VTPLDLLRAAFPWYVAVVTALASVLILLWLVERVYSKIVKWMDLGPALVDFLWERARRKR